MRHLKKFNENWFKNLFTKKEVLELDVDGIKNLISQTDDKELKQILIYISRRVDVCKYITSTKSVSSSTIQKLKDLGFIVSVEDETDEYSEEFYDTVIVSWEYKSAH